uniref:Uncharacterized protein n=1 Tax=Dasyclonium flaccidum TaxID=2007274 RepID=A0A1Z1MKM4_9FLOR|nr:hypothetical protein [Dasyclonium flaccidum]ARW66608.1 hypothetical protein [Dasyclonium flaccidum]
MPRYFYLLIKNYYLVTSFHIFYTIVNLDSFLYINSLYKKSCSY